MDEIRRLASQMQIIRYKPIMFTAAIEMGRAGQDRAGWSGLGGLGPGRKFNMLGGTQGSLEPGSVGQVPWNSTPVISEGLQQLSMDLVQNE